jgi:transposase InsO family protein
MKKKVKQLSAEVASLKHDLSVGADGLDMMMTDEQAVIKSKRLKTCISILEALHATNPFEAEPAKKAKKDKSKKRSKVQKRSEDEGDSSESEAENDQKVKANHRPAGVASREIPRVDADEASIVKVHKTLQVCYNLCDASGNIREYLKVVKTAISGHQSLTEHLRDQKLDLTNVPEDEVQTYVNKRLMSFYGQASHIALAQAFHKMKQGSKQTMRTFLCEFRSYLELLNKSETDEDVVMKFLTSIHDRSIMKQTISYRTENADVTLKDLAAKADEYAVAKESIRLANKQHTMVDSSDESESEEEQRRSAHKKKKHSGRDEPHKKKKSSGKRKAPPPSDSEGEESAPADPNKGKTYCKHCKKWGFHQPDDCWELDKNKHLRKGNKWNNRGTAWSPEIATAMTRAALPEVFDHMFALNVKNEAQTYAISVLSLFQASQLPKATASHLPQSKESTNQSNPSRSSTTASASSEDSSSPAAGTVDDGLHIELCIDNTIQKTALDTGAIHASFITKSKAIQLNLTINKYAGAYVIGYDNVATQPVGRTDPVVVSSGLHMTLTSFVVVETLTLGDIVLGLPDMTRLQLLSWNLPNPIDQQQRLEQYIKSVKENRPPVVPQNKILSLADDDEIEPIKDNTLSAADPKDKLKIEALMEEIGPLLDVNEQITDFMNIPHVKLELLDSTPIFIQPYGIPEAAKPAVRAQILKWLSKGRIRKGHSKWNLPLTTAIKKDEWGVISGTRVCIDPRALNKILINDGFPIPNIRQIHESFRGKKYFTEIDLEDAFLQMKLAKEDEEKLSFTWEGTQYSFVGCPYGLKIMSNVFQRAMQEIFSDLDFVKIYIDNISIASATWQEHRDHVKQVLARMNEYNLKLSRKKFKVGRRAIRLLGKEIRADGVRPDPRKVAQVTAWPFPANAKALKSFLGVVGYLRGHIRQFPGIAKALNRASVDQMSYDREVALNRESMENSFELLKAAIAHAPLIRYPDFSRDFHIAPDASRVGIGAVLYQPTPDQEEVGDTSVTSENIVMITSRSLNKYEQNYVVYKLEALAIITALREFNQFICGRKFTLHSDHRALTYVMNNGKHHPTLGNWLNILLEYDFTIEHVPGIENVLPDHLSRLYTSADAWGVPNTLASTRKQQQLKDELQRIAQQTADKKPDCEGAAQQGVNITLATKQIRISDDDESSKKHRKELEKEELMRLLGREIPPPERRANLIKQAHEEGHYGVRVIIEKIYNTYRYWWPTMREDVESHIKKCSTCHKYNAGRTGYHPTQSPLVNMPNDWWQMDLIHMPTSLNGFSYILCIVDLFTGYAITKPLKTKTMEEVVSQLYTVLCEWGPPLIIQSDEGKEFVNKIIEGVKKIFKMTHHVATPYSHRAMGSVERLNRTVEESLRKMLSGSIQFWDVYLPMVTFHYNTTVRSLRKSSPYSLMFTRTWNTWGADGRENLALENFDQDDLATHLSKFDEKQWKEQHQNEVLQHIYPAIAEAIKEKRNKQALDFAKRHRIVKQRLSVGDTVMVLDEKRTDKHAERWLGPYKVESVTEHGSYYVVDDVGQRLKRTLPQLKPVKTDDDLDPQDVYIVEKIIRHRATHGKLSPTSCKYLVKWKDYPHSENSWITSDAFVDTGLLTKYWEQMAGPRHTRATRANAASVKAKQPKANAKRKANRK